MQLNVQQLSPFAIIPTRANATDSGLDLYACYPSDDEETEETCFRAIPSGDRLLVPTGIAIALPKPTWLSEDIELYYEAQIRPKSSLSKIGIYGILGTVDHGYRGELMVILENATPWDFIVPHGPKVGQLVICPIIIPSVNVNESLAQDTERGVKGFGSSGARL